MRRFIGLWLLGTGLLTVEAEAKCCPFCPNMGQTLTMEMNQAAFIVYGSLHNAKLNKDADGLESGTTDMRVEHIVKDHAYLKDKKTVQLPRYLPIEPGKEVKFLVFFDLFKDRLDPYRGEPVKDDSIVKYLRGALDLKDKDVGKKLAFFFDYLDHEDINVGLDAYKEFANADYKDVLKMIETVGSEKVSTRVAKWLDDEKTPVTRFGLYGSMLGYCGIAKDAKVLLELLDDPQRGLVSGIDGVLAGYMLLQPKEGWQYLVKVVSDPKREFTRRHAALRTIRFFWEYRPDIIAKKDLLDGMQILMEQDDMADLPIEDLRRWKVWELLDKVLSYHGKESHNVPIIQKSILRYALSCPLPKAKKFVEEQRKLNPDRVKDVEELLKLETPPEPKKGS